MTSSRSSFLPVCMALSAGLVLFPRAGWCAEYSLDGALLGLSWVTPFIGMLLCIALCPILTPAFWSRHSGKTAVFWGLAFLAPFAAAFGFQAALHEWLSIMLLEYIPFLTLLFALFTVAGGIRLKGDLAGTPAVNTGILFVGTILASWMGTTGAAMLLIRPLLRANAHRKYKVHSVIFFIFLVANIGGALTPLGDPPLFLGFLQGVPFFWPFTHLLPMVLMLGGALLAVYFTLDRLFYAREGYPKPPIPAGRPKERLAIEGAVNVPLLAAIVGATLLSGVWRPGAALHVYGIPLELQNITRDILLLAIAAASLALTRRETRKDTDFSWTPMEEVAKLFFGIFVSMVPAIAILKAGEHGVLAPLAQLVNAGGQPQNAIYFWLTGTLSSFLDNAPTYLVFFSTAGGAIAEAGASPVQTLTTTMAPTLAAISAGAVFMGANTYIGNAPNFMVRVIAENSGVAMPSFFGYMAWSGCILLPLFALTTVVFF
jgi:Na+/H+ antiporter NhaD/arsenite permease-like protein